MRRILWLGSAAAALLLAAAAIVWLRGTALPPSPRATLHPPAAAPSFPQASAPPAAAALPRPSFDIVTVDPRGHAVIAGRAAPGDHVRVLDDGKPIGEVTADARGEWVLLPDTPLAVGNRQLALEATEPGGGPVRHSSETVALSVTPPGPGGAGGSLAVLLPGDTSRPARILQQPPPPAASGGLSLDAVEYRQSGQVVLSGRAAPGDRLNVYARNRLLGSATADPAGAWSLTASAPPAGAELRVEELTANGSVARRLAAALAPPGAAAAGGNYVVVRGNSLWLIARRAYGQGLRYTEIYRANRAQIRNPDKIFPGQRFVLPKS